jgi:hypothetical protein
LIRTVCQSAVLFVAVACESDDPGLARVEDVVVELSPTMPTVVHVRWSTEGAVSSHIEFGELGVFDRRTPDGPAHPYQSATLVGLPQDTKINFRIVSGDVVDIDRTVTTGTLPDAPVVAVLGQPQNAWIVVPVESGGTNRVVLLDPAGRVTWDHVDTRDLALFRALVRHDGDGIVFVSSIQAGLPSPDSALVYVSWDGVEEQEIAVPDLAHDFIEQEDGTLVALAYETRDSLLGNQLLEVTPSGNVTQLWSTWDCYDPAVDIGDDPQQGWTHANALDADDGGFLVGLRNFNAIVHVDPSTRTCPWALGGIVSTLDVTGQRFEHQHQFARTDHGVLVFDNSGAPGLESRVLEYDIDDAAGTATSGREIHDDPPSFTFVLGDVHRFQDGDTLVVWSGVGAIDRVTSDDAIPWHAELVGGGLFGFVHVFDEEPSIAR